MITVTIGMTWKDEFEEGICSKDMRKSKNEACCIGIVLDLKFKDF